MTSFPPVNSTRVSQTLKLLLYNLESIDFGAIRRLVVPNIWEWQVSILHIVVRRDPWFPMVISISYISKSVVKHN